jgi:hypothetical protein
VAHRARVPTSMESALEGRANQSLVVCCSHTPSILEARLCPVNSPAMERPNSSTPTRAGLLAGIALALYVLVLFLPLHLWGSAEFSNDFPSGYGTRLSIGFLIRAFTLPVIIAVGLLLVSRGRRLLAAGVSLASGIAAISEGLQAPFYALFRLRPILLLALLGAVGMLLLMAAWQATGRKDDSMSSQSATLPPPP